MDSLESMLERVVDSVQKFVARSLSAVTTRLNELERRLLDTEKSVLGALTRTEIEALTHSGLAPVLETLAALRDQVIEVMARPVPRDGHDADPNMVRAMVQEALAALPKPKDADPVVLAVLIQGEVKDAIEGWHKRLDEQVAHILATTAVNVTTAVQNAVAGAVAALPKPKDGKDADMEDVRTLVWAAVEALPRPKDGRDAEVDYKAIWAQMQVEIQKAVSVLPKPKDGRDADPVHPDTLARLVHEAVNTTLDRAVAALPRPRDGEDGRDAMQCEVLLDIDPTRSYQRGTYACAHGGLVRAFRATEPLDVGKPMLESGWTMIARGIDHEEEQWSEDGRIERRTTYYTDGPGVTRIIEHAQVLDRGVWREGEYKRGDGVTCGGSWWIAQRTTRARPDSGTDDWRLAVKKGRDGRDAVPKARAA